MNKKTKVSFTFFIFVVLGIAGLFVFGLLPPIEPLAQYSQDSSPAQSGLELIQIDYVEYRDIIQKYENPWSPDQLSIGKGRTKSISKNRVPGLRVLSVRPNGLFAKLKLQVGDLIVVANNSNLISPLMLKNELLKLSKEQPLQLKLIRKREYLDKTIRLN